MQSFDLTAALPQGAQVVIEASAGTGKTYTLAGLVVALRGRGGGAGIGES